MTDGPNTLETASYAGPPTLSPAPRFRACRPVLSLLAVVGLVAAVLGVVSWTSAANPRLGLVDTAGGGASDATGFLELTNDGPLGLEVEDVTWATQGLGRPEILLGPPGSSLSSSYPAPPSPYRELDSDGRARSPAARESWTPVVPFALAPGETRVVVVHGTRQCPDPTFDADGVVFEAPKVNVRTAVGLRRQVTGHASDLSLGDTCP